MSLFEALESSKQQGIRTTIDALREMQERLSEYPCRPQQGMIYSNQAKYVSWRFSPNDFKTIEILHLTDLQFGHVECRVRKWQEYQDWVLSKPNRFVLFGGDMIDAATIMSPGEPWENICGPQRQIYKFCDLVAPLRGRILGFVGGNHERRGIKTFGDLGLLIAQLLRVPYSNGQQWVDIHFGDHKPYKIHLWHGSGASRTKGAKVQMLHRFMTSYPGSDLYLVGHLHDAFLLPCVDLKRDTSKCSIGRKKIYGGMSSSFLDFMGTYAEVAGMTAVDIFMLRCILEPNGKSEITIR